MTGEGSRLIYIHVEEASMEETLKRVVPSIIGRRNHAWKVINHGSKHKLLKDLPARFTGYARRIPDENLRVLVLVDRDNEDCHKLKARLEISALKAGLPTKSSPDSGGHFRVVNRIVIEELEAWFFGDIEAVRTAFPALPETLAKKRDLRYSDSIKGGTWEKFRDLLQKAGYYRGSPTLPKCEVARRIAPHMNQKGNASPSFNHFVSGLEALCD